MLKQIIPIAILALLAGCTTVEPVPEEPAEAAAFAAAIEHDTVPREAQALPDGVTLKQAVCEGETKPLGIDLFLPGTGGGAPRPALLFLPEGYYTLDNRPAAHPFCAELAAEAGCVVALPEFRLAPEHPYPAALDDILAVYNHLITHAEEFNVDPEKIYIGGEGTGAELAISAIAREYENTEETPAGILLFNPFVGTPVPPAESTRLQAAVKAYNAPKQKPNIAILPRMLMISAENDLLRDQGETLAQKLKSTGKEVKLLRFKDAGHGFLAIPRYRSHAVKESADFLTHTTPPGT